MAPVRPNGFFFLFFYFTLICSYLREGVEGLASTSARTRQRKEIKHGAALKVCSLNTVIN